MTTIYCDKISCDKNCDYECVADFIHITKNGECTEINKDGETND